jgi:hypothetical protein
MFGAWCAAGAGIETAIGCHTFRATGITDYLTNGGRIEVAGHEKITLRHLGGKADAVAKPISGDDLLKGGHYHRPPESRVTER